MDPFRSKALAGFYTSSAVTGASGGVTVTAASAANIKYQVEQVSFSGDAAALVTLTWTSGGTSTTWKRRYAGAFADTVYFPPGAIEGDVATVVTLNISANTTNAEVSLCGYKTRG